MDTSLSPVETADNLNPAHHYDLYSNISLTPDNKFKVTMTIDRTASLETAYLQSVSYGD
jgi:hypothetical protein